VGFFKNPVLMLFTKHRNLQHNQPPYIRKQVFRWIFVL